MTPVSIPGKAVGKTILLIVSHLLAPKESDASRIECGTAAKASCEAEIIKGRARIPSVRLPESIETPKPKKLTNTAKPKSPKTTEGTPAKLLILIRIIFTTILLGEYSQIYIAQANPKGTAKTIEPNVKYKVPIITGATPPSVIAFLGGCVKNSHEITCKPRVNIKYIIVPKKRRVVRTQRKRTAKPIFWEIFFFAEWIILIAPILL